MSSPAEPVKIVIAGGGFAGRTALSHFLAVRRAHNLHITLIDDKPFFEFTPSVLRCIVDPKHLARITFPQKQSDGYDFVHGRVSTVTPSAVTVQLAESADDESGTKSFPFDYCIWAVGVSFSAPIHTYVNGEPNFSVDRRQIEFSDCHGQVIKAKDVLIVGAGAVGVELAAELIHLVKDAGASTTVTLATSPRGLLPRLPVRAGKYASDQLTRLGVKIVQARMSRNPHPADDSQMEYVSSPDHPGDKVVLHPDVVFECTGAKHSAEESPLVAGGVCQADEIGANGCTRVRPSLQLSAHDHIFIAGDAAHAPGEDEGDRKPVCEKTVYSAEAAGELAAANIITMLTNKKDEMPSLLSYPEDAFPCSRFPRVFVISLYKSDAIMTMENFVICGRVAAGMKSMFESMGVPALKGRGLASMCLHQMASSSFVFAKIASMFSRN